MPRASEHMNDSPQGILRQIILIQILIAFLAVFLIIATAKPNQYRSKMAAPASFSTLDTNAYTIFTASDHAPTLLAFVYSIWSVTSFGDSDVRPNIILFTGHEQTAIDVKTMMISENSISTNQTITILSGHTSIDNEQSLWKAAVEESSDNVVVWMDPGVTVASAHLLAQLPRFIHQKGGRWSACTSETVCTIVGLDTTVISSLNGNYS